MDYYNMMQTSDKEAYLAENGWHFNKKACEDAVRGMKRKGPGGKAEPLEPWSREQVDQLLEKYGVKLVIFDEKELEKAIVSYQQRDRRFGGVKK